MGVPSPKRVGAGPIEHHLDTWPEFFCRVWSREKLFEVRKDDGRDFRAGDSLLLREGSQSKGYTGRAVRCGVSYLLGGQWPGLETDYVVMSLDNLQNIEST